MQEGLGDPGGCPRCAELRAENVELRRQLTELSDRIRVLEERLAQNSSNSHKPPSSDPPFFPRPTKRKSGRKRGAQHGHRGKARMLLPPDRVQRFVDVRSPQCAECGTALVGSDPKPQRHQVAEIPPVCAEVTEYRLHRLRCPQCGRHTRADLPPGVPAGAFGPRLQAVCAMMRGAYRLSKRNIQQVLWDLYAVPLCLGSVHRLEQSTSAAVALPVEKAARHVRDAAGAVNVDETGWKQDKARAWLWVAVRGLVAVFLVRASRSAAVAEELLGTTPRGTIISDRWSGYSWIPLCLRQLCWSHLVRDFRKAAEREGPGKLIAAALESHALRLLKKWKRVRDGTLTLSSFRSSYAVSLRRRIDELLEQGMDCADRKLSALCRRLSKLDSALWTFAYRKGVEPTNNAAERALRHAVLWRKSSFGTKSTAGSVFVERMLTVVMTLRLQRRNVLEYLTDASRAHLLGLPAPSLLPAAPTRSKCIPA